MSLDQRKNIAVRLIPLEDSQRICDFMQLNFSYQEPLSTCHGPGENHGFPEDNIRLLIKSGYCLKAIDPLTNELLGVCINESLQPDEEMNAPNAVVKTDSIQVKIHKFLTKVKKDADLFKRFNVPKIFHISAMCVKKGEYGNGIGKRFFEASQELAKNLEFELIAADCTSFYSAKILDCLGWNCVNTINYMDYLYENNEQVFKLSEPHKSCKTFAIRL
ncbi:arylalkylamine N-acetyltransferase-like 2 [Haematobia irritans]|uniref:arylalkylamine N-acetyltransferase-like 2 n=1 Tax=Haematobia irritans TaxID=7368 RepID=UPI003F50BBCF